MSHFFNLKRIIFNHCYNLKDFFAYMETNLNKFDKLVEIEIFDCIGNLYVSIRKLHLNNLIFVTN